MEIQHPQIALATSSDFYQITLPDQYPYVLGLACLIGFECLLVGFIVVGFKRSKVFTKAWLEETFGRHHYEELTKAGHPEANSVGPAKGGYPDCGNGVYSQKLSYE